jgi:hypothetical protein
VIGRKKRRDPALAGALERFRPVAALVDRAQRALLAAVPTSRDPGAPLLVALDAFEGLMAEVERAMPAWRIDVTEEWWVRCSSAVADARANASSLRSAAPGPSEFEKLNAALNDVIAPLEEFAFAERRLLGRPV